MKRRPKYRLLGQQRLHAEQLLHQQLYVMGRDIESRHGNLLLSYGGNRQQSPMHSIPSLYTFQLTNQRRIALRNFGVLIGDDALGGMYIDRKNFEARLMRDAKLDMPLWLPRHLPPTHAPRSAAERLATAKLMRLLVEWFCGYEEWIQNSFGRRYRVGQLVRFKTRNNQVWKWNMLDGWESVLEWLG